VLVVARSAPLPEPIGGSVLDLYCRWDCHNYLRIAADGYSIEANSDQPDATSYAFFPLYPLLVGLLSATTSLPALASGVLLSNTFAAAALVYVYFYARDLGFSHRAGMLGVTLISFAPPSVVFSAPLSESLFLLLLAAAVFHLRRGEYLASAVAAALLSGTRPNGVAFVAFAVVWLIREQGLRQSLKPWARPAAYLPLALAPLGLFAFWTFSFATTGDAFAHVTTNRHGWGWGATGPVEMLALLPRLDESDLMLMAVGAAVLGLSLLLLRYRLYAEFALVLASLAFIWSGGLAPWSMPRFALVLFPVAVVMGKVLERRPGATAAVLGSAGLLGGFVLAVGWAMEAFVV
jgi:hypothetical protein